ncbi:MAG: hypothetical protein VX589_14375 [Myxococcota bacterium]|nr:hypothetical protein [Myxococcota bacterium]
MNEGRPDNRSGQRRLKASQRTDLQPFGECSAKEVEINATLGGARAYSTAEGFSLY